MSDAVTDFQAPHVEPWEKRPALRTWLAAVRLNMLNLVPARAYRAPITMERIGPLRLHILSSPAAFRHVFRDHVDRYPKAPIMSRMLGPYLGSGLLLAKDCDWHWQRRALTPAFAGGILGTMAPAMRAVADRTVRRLIASSTDASPVPMSFEMRVTATEMVRHTIASGLAETIASNTPVVDRSVDPDELATYRARHQTDLDRFLQQFGRPGLADLLGLPAWLQPHRLLKSAPTEGPRRVVLQLIAQRRRDRVAHGDILDLLLAAQDPETGRRLSDGEVCDNLLTFIITGSDTTALALTWAVYILTQRPDWASRLRAEADMILDKVPDFMIADHLPLTRAFLNETLRLFPPVPLVVRRAQSHDTISGQSVRRGDSVLAPIYTLHRHPDIWEAPHSFKPSRFLSGQRPAGFSYLPFGAGTRSCIGAGFAMTEAIIALATMVRSLDFRLADGWRVKPLMMLTLKPDGGLPVVVSERRGRDCAQAGPAAAAVGPSSSQRAPIKGSI